MTSPLPLSAELRAVLDPFFRGFGFESEADLEQLGRWTLEEDPARALAVAQARLESWLLAVVGAEGGTLLARGRAAFVLCGAAAHGASLLATPVEALPVGLVQALRAALPVPCPAPLPGAMPEQQLVLNPVAELLRRCWRASEPDMSVSR